MNRQAVAQTNAQRTVATVPSGGLLQRACACGQHTSGGECAECSKKRLEGAAATGGSLQRKAAESSAPNLAPPIVHEVLESPGQPLDANTREFFEPRLGHDFSHVRVHTDTRAAESARAVNALAYTVGKHVVFGNGQYSPGADAGQHLLAHELTHTVQQRHNRRIPTSLRLGRADDSFEVEAERSAALLSLGFASASLSTSGPEAGTIQRGPGAVAALAGAGALAFLAGFGIAFGIDYLSMTRARAEGFAKELDASGWLDALPNCPCAPPDGDTANWVPDNNPHLNDYHPGAASSYRSSSAALVNRSGQQCTYDAAGGLITTGPGAGTPDFYGPSSTINIPYHIVYDVKTWKELGWSTYNQTWRPNNGNGCASNAGSQKEA